MLARVLGERAKPACAIDAFLRQRRRSDQPPAIGESGHPFDAAELLGDVTSATEPAPALLAQQPVDLDLRVPGRTEPRARPERGVPGLLGFPLAMLARSLRAVAAGRARQLVATDCH